MAQVKPEVEPNDKRDQAQEVRLGDTIEGGYQKDFDQDWYKLVVDKPAGGRSRWTSARSPDTIRSSSSGGQERGLGTPGNAEGRAGIGLLFHGHGGRLLSLAGRHSKKTIPDKSREHPRSGALEEGREAEPNDNPGVGQRALGSRSR